MKDMQNIQKLLGKTALVTGGTSGIGLAITRLFREHGARLLITGRDQAALDAVCHGAAGEIVGLQSDASDLTQINVLMKAAAEHFQQSDNQLDKPLDILVVNAAVAAPAPFELVNEQQFDQVVAVNLKGTYFTIQQALPLLSAQAVVIVITSITNQIGSPNFSVYAACKAAQRSLVQTLALELIDRGVRVNAISPGPITTPMWHKMGLPADAAEQLKLQVAEKSPSKRFGTPEEIAKVALFLASDDSAYIVGEEIVVDGGMTLL